MEERGDEEATKRKNKNGDGRNNWRRKQVEDKTM